jgi:hypothetical protein
VAPGVRKLVLTAHVACSVGWLGAVTAFLALAVAGLRGRTSAYPACELVGWSAIAPLCFASFATGVVQGLGTPWGLVRHYWVLIKLVITVLATAILLVHMRPIARAAHATDVGASLRLQIVIDAALAIVALVTATVLSIYKPRGTTRWGRAEDVP